MGDEAQGTWDSWVQIHPHRPSCDWGDTLGQLPALPTLPQAPGSRGLLHSEDEVALPCIHKLVAGNGDMRGHKGWAEQLPGLSPME